MSTVSVHVQSGSFHYGNCNTKNCSVPVLGHQQFVPTLPSHFLFLIDPKHCNFKGLTSDERGGIIQCTVTANSDAALHLKCQ
jgi:hypothetical protein